MSACATWTGLWRGPPGEQRGHLAQQRRWQHGECVCMYVCMHSCMSHHLHLLPLPVSIPITPPPRMHWPSQRYHLTVSSSSSLSTISDTSCWYGVSCGEFSPCSQRWSWNTHTLIHTRTNKTLLLFPALARAGGRVVLTSSFMHITDTRVASKLMAVGHAAFSSSRSFQFYFGLEAFVRPSHTRSPQM